VQEAIRLAKVRAVVVTGGGGIRQEDLGDEALHFDQVPFDWLLPQMDAVIHHGGLGTVAAALASGRPQVVCPFMTSQHFYADRLHSMGVSPAPIPQIKLSEKNLASAIQNALEVESFAERARTWGAKIRVEAGVSTAVKFLEEIA
jgi:sterol 3beta-glucosyltransferase